jgi:hypothetical protein
MFALRERKWRGKAPLAHDPEGKTLGILGMGGIGRNLKKKAEAFGMKVIYYNRKQLSDELAAGAKYVSFDELLATSDVISLNIPLNVSPQSPERRGRTDWLSAQSCAASLTGVTATYPTHNLYPRIREDEEGRGDHQHCAWRCDR